MATGARYSWTSKQELERARKADFEASVQETRSRRAKMSCMTFVRDNVHSLIFILLYGLCGGLFYRLREVADLIGR